MRSPTCSFPPGEVPPGELQIEDVEEGNGDEAADGSTVEVHYVGHAWSSRHEDI
jgi:peptidylprolyl isomerase